MASNPVRVSVSPPLPSQDAPVGRGFANDHVSHAVARAVILYVLGFFFPPVVPLIMYGCGVEFAINCASLLYRSDGQR
jgi:hypothetical protein